MSLMYFARLIVFSSYASTTDTPVPRSSGTAAWTFARQMLGDRNHVISRATGPAGEDDDRFAAAREPIADRHAVAGVQVAPGGIRGVGQRQKGSKGKQDSAHTR
jgi:hypothetical protein